MDNFDPFPAPTMGKVKPKGGKSKHAKPKAKIQKPKSKSKPKSKVKIKPTGKLTTKFTIPKLKSANIPKIGAATAGPSGSGSSGVSKKKEDGAFDLEQQFILRMQPGTAMALRRDVESGAMNLKDRLFIELHHDMRHSTVRYGDRVFKAKVVDLPCVIESLKTTDRKTFYKTADICQMLVCYSDDETSEDEPDTKKPKDKDKKYIYNHGITPPLKNVRKRRFRKTMKKKHPDQPEMEKEVKRLFRMDNEAIDVKWEVVVEDDPKQLAEGASGTTQVLVHGERPSKEAQQAATMNSLGLEYELFGCFLTSSSESNSDLESEQIGTTHPHHRASVREAVARAAGFTKEQNFTRSELSQDGNNIVEKMLNCAKLPDTYIGLKDEGSVESMSLNDVIFEIYHRPATNNREDCLVTLNQGHYTGHFTHFEHDIFGDVSSSEDEEDKDINIMDSGDEDGPSVKTESLLEGDESVMSSVKDESYLGTDLSAETSELQDKLTELSRQLEDIRDRRLQQEMELEMMEDPTMKERLQKELNQVIEEENEKQQEYEILASMLNQN